MIKNLQKSVLTIALIVFGFSNIVNAQIKTQQVIDTINKDDLGEVSDQFQEAFFKALAQKGRENYEQAVTTLKSIKNPEKDNQFVIYFELGENYKALKNYGQAANYLQKALDIRPNDHTTLIELYDVYDQAHNYNKAIKIATDLAQNDPDYYEDLAQLYFLKKNYAEALKALDQIDEAKGRSAFRAALRRKVYKQGDDKSTLEKYLKQKVNAQPENMLYQSDLLYVYSQTKQFDKATEIAKKLLKNDPESGEAYLALYKIYLNKNQSDKAINAMKIVLNDEEIGNDVKKDVINDFRKLIKKQPGYEDELVKILGEQATQGHQSNQQLGEYYIGKDNLKAITYFEKALEETPQDFKLIKETLILQIKEQQYSKALKLADQSIDVFPTQPFLLLKKAQAQNGLQDFKSAKQNLEEGLDYVIDNPALELKFYQALSRCYQGLGDTSKADNYKQKAEALKQKVK